MKDGPMRCIHCEGQMKKATAPFHVDRTVPAWVCGQCGEPYFEEREVRTIQAKSGLGLDAKISMSICRTLSRRG